MKFGIEIEVVNNRPQEEENFVKGASERIATWLANNGYGLISDDFSLVLKDGLTDISGKRKMEVILKPLSLDELIPILEELDKKLKISGFEACEGSKCSTHINLCWPKIETEFADLPDWEKVNHYVDFALVNTDFAKYSKTGQEMIAYEGSRRAFDWFRDQNLYYGRRSIINLLDPNKIELRLIDEQDNWKHAVISICEELKNNFA